MRSFASGAFAVAPVLLGVAPFGLVTGLAATEIGLGMTEALGLSVVLYAGASQLAVVDLLGAGAPVWVIVLTAVVINLRYAMYSASLAPLLSDQPIGRRAAGAYLLTDQAYALTVARSVGAPDAGDGHWWFYLGVASTMWLTWQGTTVIGVAAGNTLPPSVPLGFAVPLVFLSLLIPSVSDRPTLAAGLTGALVATVGVGLPANGGMLLGALTGVGVGYVCSQRCRV